VAGVSLDRFGMLNVDKTKVTNSLDTKPAEVEALFGLNGVGQAFVTATDDATRFGTGTISSQITSIDDGVRKLQTRLADASARLALRRQQLTEQFTQMETALSRLNGQGNYLTSAIKSLQGG
jgi:flagellar hook-associated protein 2